MTTLNRYGLKSLRLMLLGLFLSLWSVACVSGNAAVSSLDDCPSGQANCEGSCVLLDVDPSHCGGCGRTCEEGKFCVKGVCSFECGAGTTRCGDRCVDTLLDKNHCGECGQACSQGEVCSEGMCSSDCSGGLERCGDRCVDTELDPTNCGSCGTACEDGKLCSAGQCGLECVGGTSQCGGICVDTDLNPSHCGGCNQACGASEVCSAGKCDLTCYGGTVRCGNKCVDTLVDPTHCGGCNLDCPDGQVCSDGQCGLACVGGTSQCGLDCVDTKFDPKHCGGCNTVCGATEVCSVGMCQLGCTAGTTKCGNECADTEVDPKHCGGCNMACQQGEVCSNGQCLLQCGTGTELCSGKCVNTALDSNHCGSCSNACPQGQVCANGSCGLSCVTGLSECSSQCVDLQLDPANCGTCGNTCNQGEVCSNGQCGLGCGGGTTKCGTKCVDTTIDPNNCGTCGNSCGAGKVCSAGLCKVDCKGGTTKCGDKCVDTTLDPNHCGMCNQACAATQKCDAGTCKLECGGGTTDCNGSCVDLDLDPNNCGTCGKVCDFGANSVATCTSGSCDLICLSSKGDCNATSNDGCEVDLLTDTSHCGGCGQACAALDQATVGCTGGSCVVAACNTGYADCDDKDANGCEVDTEFDEAHCGGCGKTCDSGESCLEATCYEQAQHAFSNRYGDGRHQYGRGIARDPSTGDILLTGYFEYSVNFGGGNLTSAGSLDVFLARFDSDGKYKWAKRFGNSSSQYGRKVASDSQGNAYACGYFNSSIDFGGGNLNSVGSTDIYIAKFDTMGNHVWSKRFGGTSSDRCEDIKVDSQDNIIATGRFRNTVDFDGTQLVSQGNDDLFLIKYTAAGNKVFAKRFGGTENDYGKAIAIDANNNNIALVGESYGTADFGGGGLSSKGNWDAWIGMYTSAGTHVWSKRWGGSYSDEFNDVAFMSNGDPVALGTFYGSANFGGSDFSISTSYQQVIVARYKAATGAHVWSNMYGVSGHHDRGYAIAIDKEDNLVLFGDFYSSINFGGSTLSSSQYYDLFLAKLTGNGAHLWSKKYGSSYYQYAMDLVLDDLGFNYLTGYYTYRVNFGGNDLNCSSSYNDIYFAKVAP